MWSSIEKVSATFSWGATHLEFFNSEEIACHKSKSFSHTLG